MQKAEICNPIVFAAGVQVINELNGESHDQTGITAPAGRRMVAKKLLQSLKKRKFPIKDEDAFTNHIEKILKERVKKQDKIILAQVL